MYFKVYVLILILILVLNQRTRWVVCWSCLFPPNAILLYRSPIYFSNYIIKHPPHFFNQNSHTKMQALFLSPSPPCLLKLQKKKTSFNNGSVNRLPLVLCSQHEIIVQPGTSIIVKVSSPLEPTSTTAVTTKKTFSSQVLTFVETYLGKDFIPSVITDGISNPLNEISLFNFLPKALAWTGNPEVIETARKAVPSLNLLAKFLVMIMFQVLCGNKAGPSDDHGAVSAKGGAVGGVKLVGEGGGVVEDRAGPAEEDDDKSGVGEGAKSLGEGDGAVEGSAGPAV
ncbi:hypothetical protein HanIR_Chr12g0588491 [Helianthus annuus]|nr:hypothetical protein HanIR_Chr12g0588491 [Helianthus annuus]